MSGSNAYSTARDVTHRQQMPGIGMPGATFRCATCDKPRMVLGRKKRRVQGVATWVCHECAGKA